MRIVVLKKGKERKIKNGYPWIFEDEIKDVVGEHNESRIANVFSYEGEFLGKGFYSSTSHIRVRMLTSRDEKIDKEFLVRRVRRSLERRRSLKLESFRVVHGEADFLPGLIVDKYKEGLVLQIRTKGFEFLKKELIESLKELINPDFIYERSDFETRVDEELTRYVGPLFGEPPEKLIIEEHGLKYVVDLRKGQKTGFFFDQRRNRLLVRNLQGISALDLYTYTGGFALNLSAAGFKEIIGVDVSPEALEVAKENARLNGLKVSFVNADALEFLNGYSGKRFDVVIADPPSLIKRKSEKKKAVMILAELIRCVEKVLKVNGIFVLCSCAYNIDVKLMIEAMRRGVEGAGLLWNIVNVTYQDIDHPWIAEIPETLYLKCVWAKLEKGW